MVDYKIRGPASRSYRHIKELDDWIHVQLDRDPWLWEHFIALGHADPSKPISDIRDAVQREDCETGFYILVERWLVCLTDAYDAVELIHDSTDYSHYYFIESSLFRCLFGTLLCGILY
jgi:hypothetical protein